MPKTDAENEHYQGDGNSKPSSGMRPPVAAMEKGPGPGIYGLPQSVVYENHSYNKNRQPAWSIKGRYGKFTDDCSPGPKYGLGGLNEAITHKGLHRSRSYTISGRNRDLTNPMKDTPGPGACSPKIDYVSNRQKAPQWHIGQRSNYKLGDDNPAPNSYKVPYLIGGGIPHKANSASYTIHYKPKTGAPDEDLAKTPGPAAYGATENGTVYRKKPQWSLGSRTKEMSRLMNNPAPNTYNADKHPTQKSAPKFSMGIRHSDFVMPLVLDAYD